MARVLAVAPVVAVWWGSVDVKRKVVAAAAIPPVWVMWGDTRIRMWWLAS